MGRPIKKKWFTAKAGSVEGNLQVTTTVGPEPIIKQTGTGVYEVASGRVKLMDGVPAIAADPATGVVGDAQLSHDGKNVSKIAQFRMNYFEGGSGQWNDGSGVVIGTLVPALEGENTDEPGAPDPRQATATIAEVGGVLTEANITDGGAGYASAPTVTITDPDGVDAIATAVLTSGVVTAITIDNAGTGYTDPVITIDAP